MDGASRLRESVVGLDAEDIALARLQAKLRRVETIQTSRPAPAPVLGRVTLRLPNELIARARGRAEREGASVSEIVQQALERLLRAR